MRQLALQAGSTPTILLQPGNHHVTLVSGTHRVMPLAVTCWHRVSLQPPEAPQVALQVRQAVPTKLNGEPPKIVLQASAPPVVASSSPASEASQSFTAVCDAEVPLGTCVYATGQMQDGLPRVVPCSPLSYGELPCIGLLDARLSLESVRVRQAGLVAGFTALVAGATYFVGDGGSLACPMPSMPCTRRTTCSRSAWPAR